MNNADESTAEKLKQALTFIATGLFQIEKGTQHEKPVSMLPLNSALRQGWEMLCYLCFQAGGMPPRTLPELMQWLCHPVKAWTIADLFPEPVGNSAALMDASGGLSAYCIELASPNIHIYNLRQELEDAIFREIYNHCWQTGDSEQYATIREFINRNIVLDDTYQSLSNSETWRDALRPLLMRCYEGIPPRCIRQDATGQYIVRCPHCGWVLEWKRDEAFCYAGGSCADLKGDLAETGKRQPYRIGMARTTEGIQRYVAAPEQSLMHLFDTLSGWWGVRCALYPQVDAYDLLVVFPGGQRWAVDLKDHQHAVRLAIALRDKPFRYEPPWDRAFYLFPDYRAERAYLNEFGNYWQREKAVSYLGISQFIQQAKEEAGI